MRVNSEKHEMKIDRLENYYIMKTPHIFTSSLTVKKKVVGAGEKYFG